jgi:hypothetical protein
MPLNEEGVYRAEFAFPDSSTVTANFYVAADKSLIPTAEAGFKATKES